jgi:hypothetical protein
MPFDTDNACQRRQLGPAHAAMRDAQGAGGGVLHWFNAARVIRVH